MTTDPNELERKAMELAERGVFLGYPPNSFNAGRRVFELLVERGLKITEESGWGNTSKRLVVIK